MKIKFSINDFIACTIFLLLAGCSIEQPRINTPAVTNTANISLEDTPMAEPSYITNCSSDGKVLFQEDFNNNSNNWEIGDNIDTVITRENRQIANGTMQYSAIFKEEGTTVLIIPYKSNLQDFFLEFTTTIIEKSDPGIARIAIQFRRFEEMQYLLRYSSDQTYLLQLKTYSPSAEDKFQDIIPLTEFEDLEFDLGRANTFTIMAKGWSLDFCLNGKSVGHVVDDKNNNPGKIGIGLSGTKDISIITYFDDIVVKETDD